MMWSGDVGYWKMVARAEHWAMEEGKMPRLVL